MASSHSAHNSRVDVSDLRRVQFSPPISPVRCAQLFSPSSRFSHFGSCLFILRLRSSSSSLSPEVGGLFCRGCALFVLLVALSPVFFRFAELPLPEHVLILYCWESYRVTVSAGGSVAFRTSTTVLVENLASISGSVWYSAGRRAKSCVVVCFL